MCLRQPKGFDTLISVQHTAIRLSEVAVLKSRDDCMVSSTKQVLLARLVPAGQLLWKHNILVGCFSSFFKHLQQDFINFMLIVLDRLIQISPSCSQRHDEF